MSWLLEAIVIVIVEAIVVNVAVFGKLLLLLLLLFIIIIIIIINIIIIFIVIVLMCSYRIDFYCYFYIAIVVMNHEIQLYTKLLNRKIDQFGW